MGGIAQASPDRTGGQDRLGGLPGPSWLERPDLPGRHRVGPDGRLRPAGLATLEAPPPDGADPELFTRSVARYAAQQPGEPVAVLLAGCATGAGALDVGRLRADGCELAISLIDNDDDVVRAAVGEQPGEPGCTLGDLRTVPLPPRSFDVAVCALLLGRIHHAELVLDRFVDALKPGGLLLLQTGDRDCAAGFLDRKLPMALRTMFWRRSHPGLPGPYPAIYEQLVSGRGIQSYVLRRGLVIAQRQATNALAGQRRPPGLLLARKLVALLSRSRLTWSHDELCYVIRKPEDRFARVL
jgi:SAM-dependent methyltransferase